jgi:hypothetical protein
MSSPCIDLDMKLMNSPVPERDGGNGGNKVGEFPAPSATEDRPLNGDAHDYQATLDANGGDPPCPSRADSNCIFEFTEGEPSNGAERMIADGKTTRHYDAMTTMVESWREELYTMNVKNAILLDDMVKLGADA